MSTVTLDLSSDSDNSAGEGAYDDLSAPGFHHDPQTGMLLHDGRISPVQPIAGVSATPEGKRFVVPESAEGTPEPSKEGKPDACSSAASAHNLPGNASVPSSSSSGQGTAAAQHADGQGTVHRGISSGEGSSTSGKQTQADDAINEAGFILLSDYECGISIPRPTTWQELYKQASRHFPFDVQTHQPVFRIVSSASSSSGLHGAASASSTRTHQLIQPCSLFQLKAGCTVLVKYDPLIQDDRSSDQGRVEARPEPPASATIQAAAPVIANLARESSPPFELPDFHEGNEMEASTSTAERQLADEDTSSSEEDELHQAAQTLGHGPAPFTPPPKSAASSDTVGPDEDVELHTTRSGKKYATVTSNKQRRIVLPITTSPSRRRHARKSRSRSTALGDGDVGSAGGEASTSTSTSRAGSAASSAAASTLTPRRTRQSLHAAQAQTQEEDEEEEDAAEAERSMQLRPRSRRRLGDGRTTSTT